MVQLQHFNRSIPFYMLLSDTRRSDELLLRRLLLFAVDTAVLSLLKLLLLLRSLLLPKPLVVEILLVHLVHVVRRLKPKAQTTDL